MRTAITSYNTVCQKKWAAYCLQQELTFVIYHDKPNSNSVISNLIPYHHHHHHQLQQDRHTE